MAYTLKTTKERISHRLKITQGHLKKVIAMVEHDTYCVDVLHQSQAIQKALYEIDALLLENHLRGCVAEAMTKGKKEEAIAEVMQVFKKMKQ